MRVRPLHTSMVVHDHAWTHSRSPWIIVAPGGRVCGRLFHYIAGGGMRAFGRTLRQDEISRCHKRLLVVAAVLSSIWLAFWII